MSDKVIAPPATLEEAQKFLREHARMVLICRPDSDLLRITLHLESAISKQVHEFTCILPLVDAKAYESKFIEKALEVYGWWSENEFQRREEGESEGRGSAISGRRESREDQTRRAS